MLLVVRRDLNTFGLLFDSQSRAIFRRTSKIRRAVVEDPMLFIGRSEIKVVKLLYIVSRYIIADPSFLTHDLCLRLRVGNST